MCGRRLLRSVKSSLVKNLGYLLAGCSLPELFKRQSADHRVTELMDLVDAFTRSVQPEGEFSDDRTPARLVLTPLRGNPITFSARVAVKGDLLEFRPSIPELISAPGTYRLTIVSSNEGDAGIRAAEEGSALDGDFDGESGASFRLLFTMGAS